MLPIIWSEMLFSSLKIHFLVPDAFQIEQECMFYTNTPCKAHFSSRNCTIAIELLLLLTIFGTIAIDIAIAKDTSRLLLLVLLLLRGLSELLLLLLIAIFTIGQLWFGHFKCREICICECGGMMNSPVALSPSSS